MAEGWYVVTGATRGIGEAVARGLVARGERVALVCRGAARGQQLAAELSAHGPPVEVILADLGTLAGARQAAAGISARLPRVAALIHNAGVWPTTHTSTADGLEEAFVVNHLAPFVMTRLLLPHLLASAPCRIVCVSAGLYLAGRPDPERTPTGADFSRFRTYANTKRVHLSVMMELARRLPADGRLTLTALHPGVVRTGLGEGDGVGDWLLRQVKRLWLSPGEGAAPILHLATDPALAGVNAAYFDRFTPQALKGGVDDDAERACWWERSCALGGLPEAL